MRAGILVLFGWMISGILSGATHHVGTGFPNANLTQAAGLTSPGDTILFHAGIYQGGDFVSNLQGNSTALVYILAFPGDTVIIDGGNNAWQISDGAWLYIRGFIFEHQAGNGVNMDDGGTYVTPAHHLVFDSCIFRDMNATGNNDLLKLSGVDSFEVRNCIFLNGSSGGGDAIDMVGCHDGIIKNCRFENMGAGSIQCKGGSRNIRIEANFFKNGGDRSLNLGGSTGMQFFRPDTAHYEAADLKVYSNVFIGSEAPIAFVGCINTEVVNNTIYLPDHWVIRILQENLDSQVVLCSNNVFRNNIIYHDNQVSTDCNIGPNTLPSTFIFSNNHWVHSQNAGWGGPSLPVTDSNAIIGGDPLFTNAAAEDFTLLNLSPDIGAGFPVAEPQSDFSGNSFALPPSIGAFEGNVNTDADGIDKSVFINVYPNPFHEFTTFKFPTVQNSSVSQIDLRLYSILGVETNARFSFSGNSILLERTNLPDGIYLYRISIDDTQSTGKLIVQ